MVRVLVIAGAVAATLPAWAAGTTKEIVGGDGYVHALPDYDRSYTLPANTQLCRDAETPGEPLRRCYRLKKTTKVKALTTIPGVTYPAVLVTAMDGTTTLGFMFLRDFPDPD